MENPVEKKTPIAEAPLPEVKMSEKVRPREVDRAPQPVPSIAAQPVQEAVGTLEAGYFRTEDTEKRSEAIRALVERNNAEAANALLRIFGRERRSALKLELLTQMGDMSMDADLAPKMDLLSTALKPEQPRDVRLAALTLLAGIDDARVPQWVRQLKKDSDLTVRQVAAALASDLGSGQNSE